MRGPISFEDANREPSRLNGAIVVPCVRRIDIEGDQIDILGCVDRTMCPARWDIQNAAGIDLLNGPIPFGCLHHHHAFTLEAVVYFGGLEDAMEMTLGHIVFVADPPRVEDREAMQELSVYLGTRYLKDLVETRVA
jgi:hypothetical protein